MVTCKDDESLFELNFNFSKVADDWLTTKTKLLLRYSSSGASLKSYYGPNVTDVSQCLSNTMCYRLDTRSIEPEAFTVKLGGNTFKPVRTIDLYDKKNISTTTEFGGGCMPSCSDDNTLLDIEISQGEDYDILWQVENSDGEVVYEREDEPSESHEFKVYTWRKCLPRDDCYSYTIATRYSGITLYSDPITNYTVKWDGSTMKNGSGKNLTFTEMTKFGNVCRQETCANGASLFEAFVLEDSLPENRRANLSWALNDERSGQVIVSGSVADSTGAVLHRVHACVPVSSTCLSFVITRPEEYFSYMHILYSARLGDAYYRSSDFYFWGEESSWSDISRVLPNETTFIGTGCTSDLICNSVVDESLLDLHLLTGNEGRYPYLGMHTLYWTVRYKNGTSLPYEGSIAGHQLVKYYMPSTQYRALHCLPNDERLVFAMKQTSPVVDYTVIYDGVVQEQRLGPTGNPNVYYDPWSNYVRTPLGYHSSAPSSLSTGGSTALLLGLLHLFWLFR